MNEFSHGCFRCAALGGIPVVCVKVLMQSGAAGSPHAGFKISHAAGTSKFMLRPGGGAGGVCLFVPRAPRSARARRAVIAPFLGGSVKTCKHANSSCTHACPFALPLRSSLSLVAGRVIPTHHGALKRFQRLVSVRTDAGVYLLLAQFRARSRQVACS